MRILRMNINDRTRSLLYRVAAALACIAIISYTVFHMVSLFSAELSTVVVGSTTEETKLELDGYIFRDETVITAKYGGAVDYIAHDGLKLAAEEKIAVVYEQGNNSNISDNIDELDEKIAVLEASLEGRASVSELPSVNLSLDTSYSTIMKKIADGDMRGISENVDDMTAQMGRISVLTDEESPIADTLEYLYAERTRIKAAGGASVEVKSDRSGYFYSDVDGYESIFTIAAAEELTPDLYYKYASADAVPAQERGNAVGKMVYDSRWLFAVMVSAKELSHFEEGESYRTVFTGAGDVSVPLSVNRIAPDVDSSSALVVFECDRMPTGFSFERAQSIEIVVTSVTGINVPKSATHKAEGGLYVYILKGSVVFERRIEVVYEGSDYYMVLDGIEPDESDVYLQSNDTLILSGQNLFDGRILE